MARRARRSPSRRTRSSVSPRAKVVWVALVGALTGLGGVLVALDGKQAPRGDGLSVPALLAQDRSASIESALKTRRPLDAARWQYIVIHQTGEHFGSPASIEAQHRKLRLKGLGHHFVIGNGAGMDDGELHVGFRWLDQYPGAHAAGPKADFYNNHAISVCLVGNGDRTAPTRRQMDRLAELVSTLCREFNIPRERVILHSDIAPVSDPGRRFPEAEMRQRLAQGV